VLVAALANTSDDPCRCLNWKRSYETGLVKCGEALELYWASKKTNMTRWQQWDFSSLFSETCYTLFEKMDGNFCANMMWSAPTTEWDGGGWCYVSRECEDLKGGHPVSSVGLIWSTERNVSWKVCDLEMEPALRKLSPADLWAKAREWGTARSYIHFGGLLRWAYPILRPQLWAHVENTWWTPDAPEALQWAVQAGQPIVVDISEDPRGEAVVVDSATTWWLRWDPGSCPETLFCFHCTHNCTAAEAVAEPAADAGADPGLSMQSEAPSRAGEL